MPCFHCYAHLERQLELLTASASGSSLLEDADQRGSSVLLQIKLGLEFLCRDEKVVLLGLALLVLGVTLMAKPRKASYFVFGSLTTAHASQVELSSTRRPVPGAVRRETDPLVSD